MWRVMLTSLTAERGGDERGMRRVMGVGLRRALGLGIVLRRPKGSWGDREAEAPLELRDDSATCNYAID
ncbi:MAG: hypothetical protein RL385_5534 [Pseudomonadota bacterium]|jgi:hypothetical protein